MLVLLGEVGGVDEYDVIEGGVMGVGYVGGGIYIIFYKLL